MFLTTDPYACNGAISHINDWLLLRPIFKDGRLIAYAAMFGHMTDVGGKVPGSLPTDAREIFEEGIRVPPLKIFKNDELQTDVLTLISAQQPHADVEPQRLQRAGGGHADRRKARDRDGGALW